MDDEVMFGGAMITLIAILGIFWAARTDGTGALAESLHETPRGPWVVAHVSGSAALFAAFLILGALTYHSVVAWGDSQLVQDAYHEAPPWFGGLLRAVSLAGGNGLALWLPVVLLVLWMARPRALRLFVSIMLGSAGVILFFKSSFHRLRPIFVPGTQLDSFPSGHALAATVLAGALLTVCLPSGPHRWPRALWWCAAVAWPLLIGVSRLYLGRHFPTDILGGFSLGVAWVLVCQALLVRWSGEERAGAGRAVPQSASREDTSKSERIGSPSARG